MKHLIDVLGEFLETDKTIQLGPHLGGKAPKVTDQQISFLLEQLKAAAAQNGKIVAILISVYVAMLVVAFIIVLRLFTNPTAMRAALGGSFLSLLVIVKGLHSLWRENHGIQIMIALLPSLSPEEAIKVVESFYYKKRSARHNGDNAV